MSKEVELEWALEELLIKLREMGYDSNNLVDVCPFDTHLIEVATRKLGVMYNMLLATGMSEKLLKAIMSE